jgi:hypothetical protein
MSTDIPSIAGGRRLVPSTAITPVGSPGTAVARPGAPVTPAKALAPIAPAGSEQSSSATSPLGRSGIDVFDVLDTTDVVIERRTIEPVELDFGLETARGALLRGLAAESLATLDGVWERAQLTEEGWYLRSGALTVMGLAEEAERVCASALQLKPSSVALRFMQSLARLAGGDVTGARAVMVEAVEDGPTHPVLLMQQVVILARQGKTAEAKRLLRQVSRVFPDHPAVEFARTSVQSIAADHTRSGSRTAAGGHLDDGPTVVTGEAELFDEYGTPMQTSTFTASDQPRSRARADDANAGLGAPVSLDDLFGGVVERAMARLGSQFATHPAEDLIQEGRDLIRGLSTGGSMMGTCTAEQAHAARGVLTAIVSTLATSGRPVAPGPGSTSLQRLVSKWLPHMQANRREDATRVLTRHGSSIPDAQRRMLEACMPKTAERPVPEERAPRADVQDSVREPEISVQSEPAKGPLIPVRLGLALLEDRGPEEHFVQAMSGWIERPDEWGRTQAGSGPMKHRGATSDHGWGSARGGVFGPGLASDDGTGRRFVALLCASMAAGAAMSGAGVIAAAFGLGAVWLGILQGGSTRPHEPVAERLRELERQGEDDRDSRWGD